MVILKELPSKQRIEEITQLLPGGDVEGVKSLTMLPNLYALLVMSLSIFHVTAILYPSSSIARFEERKYWLNQ